jgi:short-subunit dehydrogenase
MLRGLVVTVLVASVALFLNFLYGPAHKINSAEFKERYGPWCIVAGASQGLGEAFAREVASHGVNLIMIARREKELNEMAENIRNDFKNISVRTIAVDLSNTDGVMEKIAQTGSDIEIGSLIYNAAWSVTGLFAERKREEFKTAVGVNVETPLVLIHNLLDKFVKRKRGGVVIISSIAGLYGSKYVAAYAATKAYQFTLAKGLWAEYSPLGVDIVSTVPGGISTPGLSLVFDSSDYPPGTQAADEVARESLQFLASRSGPMLVTGSTNRLFTFILNLLPSKYPPRILTDQMEADIRKEATKQNK